MSPSKEAARSRSLATSTADITHIPIGESGLYLAVMEDHYSRQIADWSMGLRIDSRLVVDALEMALARSLPGERWVAHSDRRSQYGREHYQGLPARHESPEA